MNISERAAQIWSVLALAAHNRQVLTYDMVSKLTGIARVGLGKCLMPIQSYCLVHRLHPLTILVVSEKTGMPGVGFIAAQDIPRAQQEVFTYDWVKHGGPSPEDFEASVREHLSHGDTQLTEKIHPLNPLLPLEHKQAILEHMEALAAAPQKRPSGAPGSELVKLAGIIPREVADEWKRIIEEDCERIDPESW